MKAGSLSNGFSYRSVDVGGYLGVICALKYWGEAEVETRSAEVGGW